MNRDINHGGYSILAFVFLELKSTSFLETESFQLWSQESTLLPLSCKKQELKRQVRENLELFSESQSL